MTHAKSNELMATLSAQENEPAELQKDRLAAHDAAEKMAFSDVKYGLDIRPDISRLNWDEISFPFEKNSQKIMQTHENGVVVCDLSTAFSQFPQKIIPFFGKLLSNEDKLELMHRAFVSRGIFVYLPKNAVVKEPILITEIIENQSLAEHILVVAEENSRARILVTQKSNGVPSNPIVHFSGIEVFAHPHSNITIGNFQDLDSENVFHYSFHRANVMDSASVDWMWGEFGSRYSRREDKTYLEGNHSTSQNVGVFLGSKSQCMDIQTSSIQQGENTNSLLFARGALNDHSKGIYRGTLKMEKEARGAIGHQKADMLLLSKDAEADPVPILEIAAKEVKCSHAATVGRLDPEKLFYLFSRGISESEARALYIRGFYEHLLAKFSMTALHVECTKRIEEGLGFPSFAWHEMTAGDLLA